MSKKAEGKIREKMISKPRTDAMGRFVIEDGLPRMNWCGNRLGDMDVFCRATFRDEKEINQVMEYMIVKLEDENKRRSAKEDLTKELASINASFHGRWGLQSVLDEFPCNEVVLRADVNF